MRGKIHRAAVGLTALILGLSGCVSGNSPPTAGGRRVTYVCDRGPQLTVTYSGESARLEGGDGRVLILRRRDAASGFWYEAPTHRLRGKGNQITFWMAYNKPLSCQT